MHSSFAKPFAFVISICLVAMTDAGDWPGWRGSKQDGISGESAIPTRWGLQKDGSFANLCWKTAIPGTGHSSPIVSGDAVFITSCLESEQQRILMRLDRMTGKIVWQRTALTSPLDPIHRLNSRSSSTPVTDGKRVYATWLDKTEMFVAAFDFDGNKIWERRPGPFASKHGFCTCPIIYREWLILNGDHDGDSFIAAIRCSDGGTVWKTPRENHTRSYGTPIVLPIGGRDQVLLTGNLCTAGFDALTGKKIWTCDGPSEQMVATLVHRGELIFSLGGYPERHLLAIKKGGTGDITKSHILWRTNKAIPYVPSPLLCGDYLHVVSDEGIYTCFEPETGRVLTRERIGTHISSSLVGAGNRVYVTDDTGRTTVLENRPGYQVVAKNELGEDVRTTPALSHGNVFIRGTTHLYCIGAAKP